MKTIKLLVVDDSPFIRNIVKELLKDDKKIEIVGEAEHPLEARELIKKLNPDVLTLDVEMPKMDGVTFLANLMRLRPMPVVMLSTLTTKGADITLQALELGAIDFIAKPTNASLMTEQDSFKIMLAAKIKQAAKVNPKTFQLNNAINHEASHDFTHYAGVGRKQHLIAIGASTGGNDAIKNILTNFPANCPPVVITQHIPKVFSARFAQRLDRECLPTVVEAQHGMKIKEGHVYIAPGDKHLTIEQKNGSLFCVLNDNAPVNRHKPSVDVLFESLIPFANNLQAVLLTGMGRDGAQALLKLKQAGARTIVQDQATSLVWGMPGAAFQLNAHCLALPLRKIAPDLLTFASFDRDTMKVERNNAVG